MLESFSNLLFHPYGEFIKNLICLVISSLAFSATANAATIYQGVIDLSNASNNAKYPTIINAEKYSIDISVQTSKATELKKIILNKYQYRNDNEIVCDINGSFIVGQTTVRIKSLTTNWESVSTQPTAVVLETSNNDQPCMIDTSIFTKTSAHTIIPATLNVELPIKDARFKKVHLSVKPLSGGFKTEYSLTDGQLANSVKVKNPGQPFKQALDKSTTQQVGYSLSLEATNGGYYHFDTEFAEVQKAK